MGDAQELPIGSGVAKAKVSTMSQISAMVGVPRSSPQMVEKHPQLIQRRLVMVAQGICDIVPKRSFNGLIANWSKFSLKLPRNMLVAQCNLRPDTMWPTPFRSDSVNVTQLNKEAEINEQKLERHCAVTKLDDDKAEKQ